MTYEISRQGKYELIRTFEENRVLLLDGDAFGLAGSYFTISEGTQGELVALDEDEFDRDEVLHSGAYKLVEFERDPEFQPIPYLFLENSSKYDEVFLPQGLPSKPGGRQKFIYTDHKVDAAELDAYLESPESGTGKVERITEPDEPPIEDYFDLTAGDMAERIRQMQPAELRSLEEYEERHKNRTTVLNTIRNQYRH